MSSNVITKINFSDPAQFNFDSDKIEFLNDKAKLKLIPLAQSFSEDFASDTGFTYDNTKAEFTGGLVRQKNQVSTNALLAGNFDTAIDLDWRTDALAVTGIINGSPTVSTGRIRCNTGSGVSWAKTTTAIETFKFKYAPLFTGPAPENINLVSSYNGSNDNDRFLLTLSPAGLSLRLALNDSSGASILSVETTLVTWSPVSSTIYEFMVVLDSVAGTVRVFVDGILLGTNSPGPWTRGGILSADHIGSCPAVYNASNGFYHDYIAYDNAQETGNYTPGYTVPDFIYDESVVTLPAFAYSGLGSLQEFTGFLATINGNPKFIINDEYWNGAAVVASSDTYATASTVEEINTNFASFAASDSLVVKVVFQTGNVQQNIDDLTVNYNGQIYPTDNPVIEVKTPLYMVELTEFLALEEKSGSDEVKYHMKIDNIYYWLNGGSIAVGDGTYATSNTLAELIAALAIAPLPVSPDYAVYLRVSLHSDDGLLTPQIESTEIGYNYYYEGDIITSCMVVGRIVNNSGSPLEGAVIEFDSKKDYIYGENVVARKSSFTSDSDGKFFAKLIETVSTEKTVICTITYTEDDETKNIVYKNLVIPIEISKNLTDIITASLV